MPVKTILTKKDGKKHSGKYVATKSLTSRSVVSSGTNASAVATKARKKGIEEPVVFYVPKKGMNFLL